MGEYSVQVDDFEFQLAEGPFDAIEFRDDEFHILHEQQSYQAKILAADVAAKSFDIEVNNTIFKVKIADHFDQLIKKLGLGNVTQQKANDIKAPMPGLVLEVAVKEGQTVSKGDGLIILEAMKMENIIKSLGDGVVKSIQVQKGTAVDKGQLLIEME